MIEEWELTFWSEGESSPPVQEWLDDLTQEQLKAISKELMLLKKAGNKLRIPHSKPIDTSLFELRERRFGYRVYYTFDKGKIIILIAAGDKSSQKRDIKIARERLAKLKGGK